MSTKDPVDPTPANEAAPSEVDSAAQGDAPVPQRLGGLGDAKLGTRCRRTFAGGEPSGRHRATHLPWWMEREV